MIELFHTSPQKNSLGTLGFHTSQYTILHTLRTNAPRLSDIQIINKTMNKMTAARQIVLDMKIARIISIYSEEHNVSLEEATNTYYTSATAKKIEEGIADLHCRSDKYLADELWMEVQENKAKA